MNKLTENEKIALDFLNELKQCTPEELERFEPIILANAKSKSKGLQVFLQQAIDLVRKGQ